MPLLKLLPREKTPPSQMLRVPTPLIEAVQELSRLHRLGYTNAVLQGLKELISEIDSSSDIDFGTNNEVIKQLALRLSKLESRDQSDSDVDSILKSVTNLEQKIEAIQTRIAQMEGASRFAPSQKSKVKSQKNNLDAEQLNRWKMKNMYFDLFITSPQIDGVLTFDF